MFSLKNVKKPLVLLCFRSKMLKNNWFYKQRGLKTKKTIGFTSKEALKPITSQKCVKIAKPYKNQINFFAMLFFMSKFWFYWESSMNLLRATDSGRAFAILVWRCYEEPLQTSCLGNHWFTVFSLTNVKNPLVLLCFRSQMLNNHWFYFVFANKC